MCAYEKDQDGKNSLFREIKDDFRVIQYRLGQDVDEAIRSNLSYLFREIGKDVGNDEIGSMAAECK